MFSGFIHLQYRYFFDDSFYFLYLKYFKKMLFSGFQRPVELKTSHKIYSLE